VVGSEAHQRRSMVARSSVVVNAPSCLAASGDEALDDEGRRPGPPDPARGESGQPGPGDGLGADGEVEREPVGRSQVGQIALGPLACAIGPSPVAGVILVREPTDERDRNVTSERLGGANGGSVRANAGSRMCAFR
jgi:hypothetical protein